MQDTDLFLSLAEIAGVFVGFGALISVRSGGPSDAHEVTYIRSVVTIAIWVVVAALAPIIVSRYDISGHDLWLACGLLALLLLLVIWIVNERTTESRELGAAYSRAELLGVAASNLAFTIPMIGALILVVLGVFPDQEPALYLTAVGLGLFLGALTLLLLVVSQRRPQRASGPAELPATGGSSA
jgi:uncharacterized membrane protein (DUF373 family)